MLIRSESATIIHTKLCGDAELTLTNVYNYKLTIHGC